MQVEAAGHGGVSYQLQVAFKPDAGTIKRLHRVLNSAAMRLPPADLSYVMERFDELAEQVDAVADISDAAQTTAPQLRDAMAQLVDLLGRHGGATGAIPDHPGELTTYGDYGLHLLDQLADAASEAERPDLRSSIEQLNLPFALWIVRNGGEIRQLSGIVNALTYFANKSHQLTSMADLYGCCCELVEASSAAYEKPEATRPAEPWRLLLLNRAVVATRSHNPELMESAYEAIVEQLPTDAERFFTEGMEQMAVIHYPDQVREVVRRYYLTHAKPRHLH